MKDSGRCTECCHRENGLFPIKLWTLQARHIASCLVHKTACVVTSVLIAGLYHLAIKTGDEKNSGTDANVWVQVYGDKGDTGQVQLKKSGIMENLFERGQTDYFTLEAGDVGKVRLDKPYG